MISQERVFPLAPPERVALLLGFSLGAPIGATSMLGSRVFGLLRSIGHDDGLGYVRRPSRLRSSSVQRVL